MAEGSYEEAISAFRALNGYRDSDAKITECKAAIRDIEIEKVQALRKEGKGAEALSLLDTIEGYQDAAQIRKEILADIRENIAPYQAAISAGGDHTIGLKFDGTVVATGYNGCGQCDVSGWKNIGPAK